MKRIVRLLLFGVFLVIVLSIGKNKWIEFRDNTASDRYSQPSYRKATDFFRKMLGMAPFASWHYALAVSYLDEGLKDQAVKEYKKTLQMDKRSVQAYLDLANIYFQQGSFEDALGVLGEAEGVISDNPDIKNLKKQVSFEYFRDAGVKAFEKGDRSQARALLNNALETDPNSSQAHYLMALALDEQKDFNQVEDRLKEAIRLDPKAYMAYSSLGNVYFGRGDFEAAIEQYQYFLSSWGDEPSVLNNMGLAYMNLEKYGLAIPCLQKALAFDPLNIETRHHLSAVYRDHGMLDKAAEGFNSIIDMRSDYPNVHNDLGDIYRKQGREQQALKEYRATIEHGRKKLSPSSRDPLLLVELAYAYNQVQEFDEAKKLIDEAIRADPNNQKAYWTLADIYRSSHRFGDALDALEKSKKVSPRKYAFIEETIRDIKAQMTLSER